METKITTCGKIGCCQSIPKTTVNTPDGKIAVITKMEQQHLQEKVDNAARIEIDGLGKVVKYEHPMADKAEESYKSIVAPKRVSFWAKIVAFFCRKKKATGSHTVKKI